MEEGGKEDVMEREVKELWQGRNGNEMKKTEKEEQEKGESEKDRGKEGR